MSWFYFYFSDELEYLRLSLQVFASQLILPYHDINMRFKNIQRYILVDIVIDIICTHSLRIFPDIFD